MTKPRYCSSCKKSKYVDANGKRWLRCREWRTAKCVEPLLTTDCTYATDCTLFVPEKAQFKSHKEWIKECWRTKIRIRLEN